MTSPIYTDQYIAPPKFATGELLSASKLNALNESTGYLHGWWFGPNIPYPTLYWNQDWTANVNKWIIRHKFRYLRFTLTSDEVLSRVQCFANGISVYDNTASPQNLDITLDLDALLTGGNALAFNEFYEVTFNIDIVGSGANVFMHNVWEQENVDAASWTVFGSIINGATILASTMNAISNNAKWCFDGIAGTNHPFLRTKLAGDQNDRNNSPGTWYITHRHRYLHYSALVDTLESGDDGFELFWDGTRIFSYSTVHSGQAPVSGCIDLYSTPGDLLVSPTVGQKYKISVESQVSGPEGTHVLMLYESPEGCP